MSGRICLVINLRGESDDDDVGGRPDDLLSVSYGRLRTRVLC